MSSYSSAAHKRRRGDGISDHVSFPKQRQMGANGGTQSRPTIDLEAFSSNDFFCLAIQEDDEIALKTLNDKYAKNVVEEYVSSRCIICSPSSSLELKLTKFGNAARMESFSISKHSKTWFLPSEVNFLTGNLSRRIILLCQRTPRDWQERLHIQFTLLLLRTKPRNRWRLQL